MRVNFSNPLLVFGSIWVFTFILFSIGMTTNIVALNSGTVILVLGNVLSAVFLYLIVGSMIKNGSKKYMLDLFKINKIRFNKFINGLLVFWIIGSILDILYSKGVPLIWSIIGSNRDYTDFGIPSFHGVVNAAYLFALTMLGFRYVIERDKRTFAVVILLLLWPVIMLGRGILLSALIQIVAVYFFFNRTNIKSAAKFLLGLMAIIFLFGWLGDLRGTSNPFAYLVREEYRETFNSLPSGFLWFYIYVTAGINNVAANIDVIKPEYYLHYTVINLLPSFIRNSLENYELNASLLNLVDQNLNTSTFYSGYISDFGLAGGLVGGMILQVSATIAYFKARSGNLAALMAYTILFECLVLSPFYDLLFLLPYLAQIALAVALSFVLKKPNPQFLAANQAMNQRTYL